MATGIDKLPSGKYRARIFRDGRKVTVGTYLSLKEAQLARARAMVNPDEERRGQTPFWKYAQTHMQIEKDRLAAGTWENYQRSYRLYLEPVFGKRKLSEITPAMVKRWWASMADRHGARIRASV